MPTDRELLEIRARCNVASQPDEFFLLSWFLSLSQLVRVTAWCRRWLRVVCEPPDRKYGENLLLLVEEMNGDRQALIQVVNYLVAKGNRSYLKKSFAAQRKCTYQVKPLCRRAGHLRVDG